MTIYPSLPAEECSYWLPLYGSMCCRLAAQPHCMTQLMMSGCLKVKVGWKVYAAPMGDWRVSIESLLFPDLFLSFACPSRFLLMPISFCVSLPDIYSTCNCFLSLLSSSVEVTLRVGQKCTQFWKEAAFSVTTSKKMWRLTLNQLLLLLSTRSAKESYELEISGM